MLTSTKQYYESTEIDFNLLVSKNVDADQFLLMKPEDCRKRSIEEFSEDYVKEKVKVVKECTLTLSQIAI